MALTKVCMWSDNSWERITVDEASRIFPMGTISAKSGLFMCSICGQHVTLTEGKIRERYFKHSAEEQNKTCPERQQAPLNYIVDIFKQRSLPLRLMINPNNTFSLEIGFIPLPLSNQKSYSDNKIIISPQNDKNESYIYSFSRINSNSLTFLSIGSKPYERYQISSTMHDEEIDFFWPTNIEGVEKTGTLFDESTGKKIPKDSNVRSGLSYLLLTTRSKVTYGYHNISCSKLCSMTFDFTTWNVYRVKAEEKTEDAARFFLEYNCRLSDFPPQIIPLWPPIISNPYMIFHNSTSMFLYIDGDADPNVHPLSQLKQEILDSRKAKLIKLKLNYQKQLFTLGRLEILQQLFIVKRTFRQMENTPKINVFDANELIIEPGITSKVPKDRFIKILSPYDGYFKVFQNNNIVYKEKIKSNVYATYNFLKSTQKIEIYQGLDRVWSLEFTKEKISSKYKDKDILKLLQMYKHDKIPINSKVKLFALNLNMYPLVYTWILKQIRIGQISQYAYQYLDKIINERNNMK